MAYNAITADVLQHISTDAGFSTLAGEAYAFQSEHCPPFQRYLQGIKASDFHPKHPFFLPIELFKTHDVRSVDAKPVRVFRSSGTASQGRSEHVFAELETYKTLSVNHFEALYEALKNFRILALLPSYLEQGESSLVFMVDHFMKAANSGVSAFFLHNIDELNTALAQPFDGKTLLIGVSYALLDFAETNPTLPQDIIVMETGGMKGRKKEMTREELHSHLKRGFKVSNVHSEYGMTELSSQAYALGDGWFQAPPWMKCFVTDVSDPLSILPPRRRGCLAFIDLANKDSCCFIQTRDIGIVKEDGHFQVEGRMDQSDVRGCNLLYT